MSARRLRPSIHNNHGSQGCKSGAGGSGTWASADSRSFPRFKPLEAGGQRKEDCPPRGKQIQAPVMACTRSHASKQQGGSEIQQVRCSSHPNVAGCCSARPPKFVIEPRPAGSKGASHRPAYPLPAPLGKYAGTKPLASLTSIYKNPTVYDYDVDEEKAWEEQEENAKEGSVTENPASHSCPISSASPEPRPSCCRRQQVTPTPLKLQVLVRDMQPANTNHQARKPAHVSRFGKLLHRKRSKTQPRQFKPSQQEPQPQPQPQPEPQQTHEKEKQLGKHQFMPAEQELAPPQREPVTLPKRQATRQQQQYILYQRNQHQMQCPSVVLEHSRTRSMPTLNDEGIYSDCGSDSEDFRSREQTPQLYMFENENTSQDQRIFRRPFRELMRSQDSIVY